MVDTLWLGHKVCTGGYCFHSRLGLHDHSGHIWWRLYEDFSFFVLCLLVVIHDEVQVVHGLPWVAELNGRTRRFTKEWLWRRCKIDIGNTS
jgi:hypothetical protein